MRGMAISFRASPKQARCQVQASLQTGVRSPDPRNATWPVARSGLRTPQRDAEPLVLGLLRLLVARGLALLRGRRGLLGHAPGPVPPRDGRGLLGRGRRHRELEVDRAL